MNSKSRNPIPPLHVNDSLYVIGNKYTTLPSVHIISSQQQQRQKNENKQFINGYMLDKTQFKFLNNNKPNIVGTNTWILIFDFLPLNVVLSLRVICKIWNMNVMNFLLFYEQKTEYTCQMDYNNLSSDDHIYIKRIEASKAQIDIVYSRSSAFNAYQLAELRSLNESSLLLFQHLISVALLISDEPIDKIKAYIWPDLKYLLSFKDLFIKLKEFNPLKISKERYEEFKKRVKRDTKRANSFNHIKLLAQLLEWSKSIIAYVDLIHGAKSEVLEYHIHANRLRKLKAQTEKFKQSEICANALILFVVFSCL